MSRVSAVSSLPSWIPAPPVLLENGTQEWRKDGLLHRLDGPAVIQADGSQHWYAGGKSHRLDGPAIIWANGEEEWWIDGYDVTDLSAHEKLAHIRAYHQAIEDASRL